MGQRTVYTSRNRRLYTGSSTHPCFDTYNAKLQAGIYMTVDKLRKELEQLKRAINPGPEYAQVIVYNGDLREGDHIPIEAIIAINGKGVSQLSKEEIQERLYSPFPRIFLPDDGRDTGLYD